MQFETIKAERINSVYLITLNRPEAKNAVNNQMWLELCKAFDELERNDQLRCGIITNSGNCFCAGADLKEIAAEVWAEPEEYKGCGFAGCTKRYISKPLIAAVNGKAIGGGIEIMMACDLAIASSDSIFSLPEPRRGLTAAGGGTLMRIMRQVPSRVAMELMLVCEPFDAQKALDSFLINKVVEPGKVLDAALEWADLIALGAPLAVEYTKRTAYETLGESLMYPSNGWDVVERYEKITQTSEDKLEGARAFAEKRKPVWQGR